MLKDDLKVISKKQHDTFSYLIDNNDKFAGAAFELYLLNEDLEELLQNLVVLQCKSSIGPVSSDLVGPRHSDPILRMAIRAGIADHGIGQTVLPFC